MTDQVTGSEGKEGAEGAGETAFGGGSISDFFMQKVGESLEEEGRPLGDPGDDDEGTVTASFKKDDDDGAEGSGGKEGSEGSEGDDPDGKKADGTEGSEGSEGKEGAEGDDPDGKKGAGDKEPLKAPGSWRLAEREAFDKLPRQLQETIIRRDVERQRDYQAKTELAAPWINIERQWGAHLQQVANGAPVHKLVEDYIAVDHKLRTGTQAEKRALFARMAHTYGIDLTGNGTGNGNGRNQPDPEVETLRSELRELKGQMVQDVQASSLGNLRTQIEAMDAAKTDDGKPRYPYLADVEEELAQAITNTLGQGRQPDVAALYEHIIWTVPAVRKRLIADQAKATAKDSKEQQDDKVRKARSASRSVRSSGTPTTVRPKKGLGDLSAAEYAVALAREAA